jgi:D-glycero-alpha-D-manno-heptose-7-phosphate kinase
MYCSVTVEQRTDQEIYVNSVDLGIEERFSEIDSLSTDGELEIVTRAIKFFMPSTGLNVTTENTIKKGSGLGASSSLLIATMGSLNALTDAGYPMERIIDCAADLEAQCIRVPTGKQDYFAAAFGGVSALWFDVGGGSRENLIPNTDDICELEKRIVLSFTGTPRFSGATNWNMIRNYIEGDQTTLGGMKRIKEVSLLMRNAIVSRDWDLFAVMVDQEWQHRRELAEGVTNPQVEEIMSSALGAGALANKICGAGGGGCMITCVEPEHRSEVEAALSAAGAEVLPFKIVTEGIKIEHLS